VVAQSAAVADFAQLSLKLAARLAPSHHHVQHAWPAANGQFANISSASCACLQTRHLVAYVPGFFYFCCRTHQGTSVFMGDVQLLLPQAEWDFVANTARVSNSFVVQLAGE
jgi:hypothetical protein